jgi:hypothetical protein
MQVIIILSYICIEVHEIIDAHGLKIQGGVLEVFAKGVKG